MIEKFLMLFINGNTEVIEFKGGAPRKKGASFADAPRTNKQWQLHKLGDHCRQKPRFAQRPQLT